MRLRPRFAAALTTAVGAAVALGNEISNPAWAHAAIIIVGVIFAGLGIKPNG